MSDLASRLSQAQRLLSAGQGQQALAEAKRALQLAPGNPDVNNAMAIISLSLGQHEQALYYGERAIQARPADPLLAVNIGMHLIALNRREDALPWFTRALELAPTMPQAHKALAELLRTRSLFTAAVEHLGNAQRKRPEDPTLAGLYAGALTNTARVAQSVAFMRDWLSRHEDLRIALGYANTLTYCAGATPQEVFDAHIAFGKLVEKSMPQGHTDHPNDPDPERILRIGILSNELRQHAVATFVEPWLEHHDRARSHITCYSVSAKEDEVSARIRAATGAWVQAAAMTGPQLTERIRADRIDVLMETTGLNQGHRMGVLWMKPAPVQATMVGYLNTTGVPRIDYRIVDVHTDPPGAERFSVEKLIRLEPTYWCYRAPDGAPDIRPRDPASPFTFGSFNSAGKLNDQVIALWSRILNAAPDSRLMLKSFDLADERLGADLTRRFESDGIDRARIQIEGPTLGTHAFYSTYHAVDIGLDTFPFNGTTTTLDALWMGVPVVALAGSMHAGRTGVSILTTLGLPDLIARTEDDYLRIATELATDAPRLAELRRTLRPRLSTSPLCDRPAFARRMDDAVRGMWRTWCAGARR